MPLRNGSRRDELERIKKLKSDKTFEKADLLKALAIKLINEGEKEEGSMVLDLASEEIINSGSVVERPRGLCGIAPLYSKIRKQDKAEETIKRALEIQGVVKDENPWKFTNNLCYVAYVLATSRSEDAVVKGILRRAIEALDDIEAYYLKRKEEIVSYLKRFSEDETLLKYLDFNSKTEMFTDVPPLECPEGDQLHKFLDDEKTEELKSAIDSNLDNEKLSKVVSSIYEEWRQAVAWILLSRLFLRRSDVERALELLIFASKKAKTVHCYWDRDRLTENISETNVEIYHVTGKMVYLDKAKNVTAFMKDPWKRARALCRIAKTHVEEERFEHAAQEINYIHSHLLDKIDYRDRTAMSMLLIADVFDELRENRANNPGRGFSSRFSLFKPNKRRADKLRRDAFSILDSLDSNKRKESLDEYEEFIKAKNVLGVGA